MFVTADLILPCGAIFAACAYQSWSVGSIDMLLLFTAIVLYVVLSQYFKQPLDGSRKKAEAVPEQEEGSAVSLGSMAHVGKAESHVGEAVDDQLEVRGQLAMIDKCASRGDVVGAMRIFRALQKQGGDMSSSVYNAVMVAWISCGNIQAAEDWMEDVREAGMADLVSFNTLVKALVKTRALNKAFALMEQMIEADVQPDIVTFSALLNGCACDNRFHRGVSLLEQMDESGIQRSTTALDGIVKLLNGCRGQHEGVDRLHRILRKFKLLPDNHDDCSGGDVVSCSIVDWPSPVIVSRLAAAILRLDNAAHTSSLCQQEIEITGALARVKAAHRTLKQQGFLKKAEGDDTFPLNGHWETDHGLTVVIEGKIVRWSRLNASRLRLVGEDRRSCVLPLYGSPTTGRLAMEGQPADATKTLSWDNGDVWLSYDGRVIGHEAFFEQTMTKVLRDDLQDQAYQERSLALLQRISRNGLCMPSTIEQMVIQFLGNDMYYMRVRFTSAWHPQMTLVDDDAGADPFVLASRRNARVGFRHCWVEPGEGCYGQRTLVNGGEVDEECFARHVGLVVKA